MPNWSCGTSPLRREYSFRSERERRAHEVAEADHRFDLVTGVPQLAAQPAEVQQVEEDGAAPEERFDVPAETVWKVRPQVRHQLALAARPLEERPNRRRGVGQNHDAVIGT